MNQRKILLIKLKKYSVIKYFTY